MGHHRAAVAAHPVVPKHVQTDVAGALFPLRLRRAELRRGGGGGGGGIGISKSTRRRQLAGAGACVVWRTCFIVSGEKLRSPSDELSADSHSAASAAGRAGLAEGDQPSPQSRRVAARCTHSDGSLGGPTSMSGPPLARHSRPRVTKRALILREGPFARGRKRAGKHVQSFEFNINVSHEIFAPSGYLRHESYLVDEKVTARSSIRVAACDKTV